MLQKLQHTFSLPEIRVNVSELVRGGELLSLHPLLEVSDFSHSIKPTSEGSNIVYPDLSKEVW